MTILEWFILLIVAFTATVAALGIVIFKRLISDESDWIFWLIAAVISLPLWYLVIKGGIELFLQT